MIRRMAIAAFLLLVSAAARAQNNVTLSYLGTAGWELTDGKTVVLIDPYLTRIKINTPNDPILPSDPRPLVTSSDTVQSDTAATCCFFARHGYAIG